MKDKSHNLLQIAIFSIVVIFSLVIGIVVYYNSLVINLQNATCTTLDEVLQQEKHNFSKTLNSDKEAMKGYSQLIATLADNETSVIAAMNDIVNTTGFEYVFFVGVDGNSLNNKGEVSYVGDRDYFKSAMLGETTISEPVKSKIRDDYVIAVATPISQNDRIVGALIGTFKTDKLNELFMSSFKGQGYTYVVTNSGEIIAKSNNSYALDGTENIFDLYDKAEFYENDSYEVMRKNLEEKKGGHAKYQFGDQSRMMHYDKLPINDWNIFEVVSYEGVMDTANEILFHTILLITGLVAIFIVLLVFNFLGRKNFIKELTNMAYVDSVTGYRSFEKFKIDAAELIEKNRDVDYMLVKMDIENFKLINEIYSMEMGDQILRAEAKAMELSLDENLDAFGRIHADEFVILVGSLTEGEALKKRQQFEREFMESCGKLIELKLKLPRGKYRLQDGDNDFAEIYEKVNFAHRLAKSTDGGDLYFDGKVKERALRETEIENKMEQALLAEEFRMYLQPKYSLANEKMVGAEALTRWIVGNNPVVYPIEFIPLFEKNGFITKLDFYMFEQACKTLQSWINTGIEPLVISVNFSRLHLANKNFVRELSELADKYEVPHGLLEIELTETAMLDSIDVLGEVLEQLHQVGFTLSMDDFGTGHSSLGLFKNIPVDVIKIDRSFFDQPKDFERTKTVIASVLEMAKKLNTHTLVEGVETQEHIDLFRELGCEMVQGYYYARPMTVTALEVKLMRSIFNT